MAPSHRPLPRRWPARSAWFGLLLALTPLPAGAQTATLVFPDVCNDPKGVFDYFWARQTLNADDLFLFKNETTISQVNTTKPFDSYPTILVIAHGNADEVGDFPKRAVVTRIHAAHPSAPDTVRFFSCNAAEGTGTVLQLLDNAYKGRVQRLFGSTSPCALTGNGSIVLDQAQYRGSPDQPNPGLSDALVANIKTEWSKGNYNGTGQSYKQNCRAILDGNLADLPTFMSNAFNHFANAPIAPDTDPRLFQNYRQLIQLNAGGTAPLECGAATGKACP